MREEQQRVFEGSSTYNQAVGRLYGESEAWQSAARVQTASLEELEAQHVANESAAHRAVGLVIETRPDAVTAGNLTLIRRLGCTKVQMGVQSLDERILELNRRGIGVARIGRAFELLRLFGFKIHVHFMANLHGATPAADKRDYERLANDPAFRPDEVKIYPCALVAGTGLCALHDQGAWRPYTEAELIDVLAADVLATPPYTRISRMIRDISAHDILVGNKKVNLRQAVERAVELTGQPVAEIRCREIRTHDADVDALSLSAVRYRTSVSDERFLQWTAPDGSLAGFLRLSLPDQDAVAEREGELPVRRGEAMIREVHVYGRVAGLHREGTGAQHFGLGKRLVEEACAIAREEGFSRVNVISSVGTRAYYRNLDFRDNGLYQQRDLR